MQLWVAQGACPLEGVCSECGLTFEWRHIIDPLREEPVEYVEYAPSQPRVWLWSCARTFGRTWLPWKFWRRLQLHHSVRPWRIVAYLLLMAVLLFGGLYVATQTATAVYVRSNLLKDYQQNRLLLLARVESNLTNWKSLVRVEDTPRDYIERAILMAARRDGSPERIQRAEVAAWATTTDQDTWDVLRQGAIDEFERMIERWKEEIDDPQPIGIGHGRAILQSVFMPWKSDSGATIMFGGAPLPYPSPGELYIYLPGLSDYRSAVHLRRVSSDLQGAIIGPIYWLLVSCAYPLLFALLPVTRRRAKVRWRHIARVWLYGLAIPIGFVLAVYTSISIALFIDRGVTRWQDTFEPLVWLAPVPFLLAWWYSAIRFHLRLPHALLVTILLCVLSMLGVIGFARLMMEIAKVFVGSG